MRKGQFIFNFLRDYFTHGDIDNPYPNCHNVIFNISDEYWDIIEKEYALYKYTISGESPSRKPYIFPKYPFGKSIISKEHEEAMKSMFKDLKW